MVVGKKSQITVFIIIGVMALIIIIIGFISIRVLYGRDRGEVFQASEFMQEFQPVKVMIDTCLKTGTERGILFIGLQGGMYEHGTGQCSSCFRQNCNCYDSGRGFSIPYYNLDGTRFLTIEEQGEELSKYVENYLSGCINFSSLEEMGFLVTAEEPKVSIEFSDVITTMLDMKVNMFRGTQGMDADRFLVEVDFDYPKIYDAVSELYLEQIKDNSSIPLSKLTELGLANGYYYQLMYLEKSTVSYDMLFLNSSIRQMPFIFSFGAMHDWNLEGVSVVGLKYNEDIPAARFGELYILKPFDMENINVRVNLPSNVDSDGDMISFNPTQGQASLGEVNIVGVVIDEKDNSIPFRLNIKIEKTSPNIVSPLSFTIYKGDTARIKIEAVSPIGSQIFYNIEGLDVNPTTGEFTYAAQEIGEHNYNVVAMDSFGSKTEANLTINVI